jgi:hypothetical protein
MPEQTFTRPGVRRLFAATTLSLLGAFLFASQWAEATPNFMRKLRNPTDGCHACHTIMPRLNEFGYRFRAAGYRVPDTIGKGEEKPFEFGDYISAGITANYNLSKTDTGTVSSHNNQLTFSSLDTFPFTGSIGRNFASKVEIDFAPKGTVTLNTAYVRWDKGSGDSFFNARIGVFGKEGYGAADRSIGASSPLMTGAANFNQTQFFTFQTTAGAEAGYDYKRTSVRAAILNGVILLNENGALNAYGAQGGPLGKPAGQVTSSSPDFQFIVNQILTSNGGGLYLQYYHGNMGLPYLGSTTQFWKNKFDRVEFYGSYPVTKYVMLLGGYGHGRDHLQTGDTFGSGGYFGQAEVPVRESVSAGFRYDWFDPARNKAANEVSAYTGFVTLFTRGGMRVTAEVQHKETLRGTGPSRFDNGFVTRMSYYR